MNLVEKEHAVIIDMETSRSVPVVFVDASASTSTSGSGEDSNISSSKSTATIDNNKSMMMMKDKRGRHSSCQSKPPKPPRPPPRALSLDAADHKLIKEMSDLAALKRARANRKKKMQAPKTGASTSNLYATIVTILFCLVILFQGLVSKGSSQVNFRGSPESAVANSGVHHAQYYKSLSDNSDGPGLLSPHFKEHTSVSSSK